MPLEIFGFLALWSPFFLVAVLFMTVVFFLITTVWRKDFKNSEPLKKSQAVTFIVAMILLYIVKGSPVDLLGHIMFSVHMIQMAILYLVIPPLLIISIPNWLWKVVIELPVISKLFSFFTKPIVALILFNGMFSFYHIPLIFDTIKVDETLHMIYTFTLFLVAICMWWPMINKLPGQYQLSGLKKVGYLFADGVLLTPACALIIFADQPMYATYYDSALWMQALALCVPTSTLEGLTLSGPQLFTNMPVQEDQQLGGVLMKIIQEIVYGVVLAQIFFQWFKNDQAEADKFNEELNANNNPEYI
ncbi:cytochrome c oxidase assembly factor CtaG [Bacillus spongiae]|uniref:Cytochrome c oxidase assembly factor CtaG n=1 Tax=Bacillus spongiae TaxID=2683610 RepID=A0ABU8H9V5_9BACI